MIHLRTSSELMEVDLAIPSALGDTIMSTAVVGHLLRHRPAFRSVRVWTKHPWVFRALDGAPRFECHPSIGNAPAGAIHLTDYYDLLPHRRAPLQHHTVSMLEIVNRRLGPLFDLPSGPLMPVFQPDEADVQEATALRDSLESWRTERTLVWMGVHSTTVNRNPPPSFWRDLAQEAGSEMAFVDFLGPEDKPIDSPLIKSMAVRPGVMSHFMQFCGAGVAVDSFGLHLSAASRFRKVVVVLGSSSPACVQYPGNRCLFKKSPVTKACQPCGNHGYVDECRIRETIALPFEIAFRADNKCLFHEPLCLQNVTPNDVLNSLESFHGAAAVASAHAAPHAARSLTKGPVVAHAAPRAHRA